MVMFVPVLQIPSIFDKICHYLWHTVLIMDKHDPIRPIMIQYGQLYPSMTNYGQVYLKFIDQV